jgi:hypothetical protein
MPLGFHRAHFAKAAGFAVSIALSVYFQARPTWEGQHPGLAKGLYLVAVIAAGYLILSLVLQWSWAQVLFGIKIAAKRQPQAYSLLPVEADALAVAKQLRGFIDEMRDQRDLDLENSPDVATREYAEARRLAEIDRWETSFRAKYKNNFSAQVTSLLGRIAEEGVNDHYVKPYVPQLSTEQDCVEQVRALAAYLTFAVSQIENKRRG